ncbi:hypothetical protein [Hyalangium versicolor]|uniref:hypothetical protein n=1 Tax=Hyalangium versicolor TaxID=2861190 RepID=UPI001CC964C0|nr:hypothetical protein [Hyalangium versicolor]
MSLDAEKRDVPSFASYFADRAVTERGFRPGVPEGAQALGKEGDVMLHRWNEQGLKLVCMVERERGRQFHLEQAEVLEVIRRCLDTPAAHTGVRRASFEVFELGLPPTAEAQSRLGRLRRSAGSIGIEIIPWILAPDTGGIWSGAPLGGFTVGRSFFKQVMREYREAFSPRRAAGTTS